MTPTPSNNAFLSFNDAVNTLLQDAEPSVGVETVPLSAAQQRVLAKAIVATTHVPSYDNSAMDGFAFRHSDLEKYSALQQIGTALAGHPFSGQWLPGCCIRIMTGAQLPEGFDTVVMQEQAQTTPSTQGEQVQFTKQPSKGQNVRLRGEDISAGETLFNAGQRLKATDIGMLASLGVGQIEVFKSLKIAVLSTGDELLEPGQAPKASHIFDTNRYTIHAMLANLGFEVIDFGILADEPDTLHRAFSDALAEADVVISSGGVSVGEADHTKAVLTELGAMQFWKVAIKPGKPFAYGHFNAPAQNGQAKRFMGLPGNPVSSVVTLHQLALPALRKMAGECYAPTPPLQLPLAENVAKKAGRMEFVRATLVTTAQGTQVKPLKGQGSGILSTFSHSSGYLLLDAAIETLQAGDLVPFLPFDSALN